MPWTFLQSFIVIRVVFVICIGVVQLPPPLAAVPLGIAPSRLRRRSVVAAGIVVVVVVISNCEG